MSDGIESRVAAWATEVGTRAARLPATERDDYIARQRRTLLDHLIGGGIDAAVATELADAAAAGAARIVLALLERAARHAPGKA